MLLGKYELSLASYPAALVSATSLTLLLVSLKLPPPLRGIKIGPVWPFLGTPSGGKASLGTSVGDGEGITYDTRRLF